MKRIYIEKREEFNIEVTSLIKELNNACDLNIKSLRLLNIYDVDHLTDDQLEIAARNIFAEANTDSIYNEVNLEGKKYFATQYLPAQFDARADSSMQCIKLLFPDAEPKVYTGKLYIFDETINEEQLEKIKNNIINKIEMEEKDLNVLGQKFIENNNSVNIINDFISFNEEQLKDYFDNSSLAMTFDDLKHIQNYFKNDEKRNPFETELLMLDTYWSDHCRHTTFETEIEDIQIEDSPLKSDIQEALDKFEESRMRLRENKPRTLMNLATINVKELFEKNLYQDVEVSSEINACSVFADVDVNGKDEKYLIQFKNETHNHPTEIEPFGGASTCLGGAIRDPLSGRSYVYQGVRVSGSGNPLEPINETIKGKLPQRFISKVAAQGFASYGNQIGMATTLVEEIIHPGFKAKRMEVGAVVAATPAKNVRREEPAEGDLIIMMGGSTGRDGIGGATGSSKEHNDKSLESSSSEVQKGNPPEERKLQRLFRKYEFSSLVKKSNDFGAGGVSVAVGELADSLEINLDVVPLKYQGLNGTDIALSESQERMAIVIEQKDLNKVLELAKAENINAVEVARVTGNNRLVMKWKNQKIVDIDRNFIETNGVRQKVNAVIESQSKFERNVEGKDIQEKFMNNISAINVASQKGMTQMFDSTIGGTTVLFPYGGKTQNTKAHVSVQKVPMFDGSFTNTATMMSIAYNPFVTVASPFLGGAYAVVACLSKIVAYGGNLASVKFSFQEYFEKLGNDPKKWGKPLAALLGASQSLRAFDMAAIGGKDSMSGTYNDINVPPTLIAFALSVVKADNVISSEFKKPGNNIYVLKHDPKDNGMPNFNQLKSNYSKLEKLISSKEVASGWPLVKGGIAEGLVQMAMGNEFGFEVETNFDIFDFNYGTIIVETKNEIDDPAFIKIGTVKENGYIINGNSFDEKETLSNWKSPLEELFPTTTDLDKESFNFDGKETNNSFSPSIIKEKPRALVPVFPGTNCEFDLERQFLRAGADVKQFVFRNITKELIEKSIDEFAQEISNSDILVLAGGFSAGDEPDGSGKFIATILRNEKISKAIQELRDRKGLIIGICNGFQALIKSGLLPYGKVKEISSEDPTLFRNNSNKHVSKFINTKISTTNSPWLQGFKINQVHTIPVSHGEGKFVVNDEKLKELIDNNQIAFQYVDNNNKPTMNGMFNPNGSTFAIEGIVSEDGLILGKMGHSERYEENIAKNIHGDKNQNIFINAVKYFKGEFK